MRLPARLPGGLRSRLVALTLLAILPGLILTLYAGVAQRSQLARDAQDEALRVTRLAAADHERAIESAHHLLTALAEVPAVRDADPAACSAIMADLVAGDPLYANLGAVDPAGEIVCSGLPLSAPVNVADRAYFQRAIATRAFAVGDYQIGRTTGRPGLNVAYPLVAGDGSVRLVLVAALDLAWLNQLAAAAALPPGSSLTVVDRNGTVLVRQPDPELWVGRSFPDAPLVDAVLDRGEGTVETTGLDGVTRLYAFAPLRPVRGEPGTAFVAVGIPSATVYAAAETALLVYLAALAAIAAVALAVAWYGGELLLLRPIRGLIAAADRVGRGDLAARTALHGTGGELGELAGAFDRMAESLEGREAALREAEQRYRSLVERLPAAVYIDAPDAIATSHYVSPQVETIMGYAPADFAADPLLWRKRLHPEDRERALAELADGLRSGAPFASEYRLVHRDGRTVWVRDEAAVVRDESGGHGYVLGVMFDLTERRQLETQYQQAQKMEAIGRLAGGIAHDFNNLLTVISGHGELLLADLGAEDPRRSDVEAIGLAADRAAHLSQQILAFSRRQPLRPHVISLDELVVGIEPMIRRLIGEDVALVTALHPGRGHVRADPGQLEQVIMNLAVNARDAMPQGGRLTIETANVELDEAYARRHVAVTPGPHVMLAVSDTGSGMDEATQARLFEPFFTTKEPGRGTGLGLATVYGIVKQSGGSIWAYSEVGKGSTFKVYLPRVDEEARPYVRAETAAPPAGGSETVLVAEDEEAVRGLIVTVLERFGYRVLVAADGDEALAVVAGHAGPIDLLLTDVVMPGMSGRELAERLSPSRPGLRVLYVSGYTANTIVDRGVVDPSITYLAKPFTPDGLARAVREVLDAPV